MAINHKQPVLWIFCYMSGIILKAILVGKMARNGSIWFSFVFLVLFCKVHCDFPTDFLGNYVSDEEYNSRTLCSTTVCMKDSDRLIDAANHDSNKTAPCDDFKTFAMGNFFDHRVPNERYKSLGLNLEVIQQYWEKQKRMLLKPVTQSDPKVFKIMKGFFRGCIDSKLTDSQGSHVMMAFARQIGIVGIAGQLNLKKAIVSLSALSIQLFFDQHMTYCKTESGEMLCLKPISYYTFSEIFELAEISQLFQNLKVDANYKLQIARDFVSYLKMKQTIQEEVTVNNSESVVMKIQEMYEKFPSKHLDWLQIINSQLLSDSQQTFDDEILIRNPQLLEGLYKLFLDLEETFAANVLLTAVLAKNTRSFTTHPFSREEALGLGAKRTVQRFEQCLVYFRAIMRPALEALSAANFYDQTVQKSATELVELAVTDAIEEIMNNEKIDIETRDSIAIKLQSAKLWIMFPDDILNVTKIDDLYNELDIKGSESSAELSMKMITHDWKLQMKPQDDWITILHKILSEDRPSYFAKENILYIPVKWTLYPLFHPNRSRFFNMATLYTSTINAINTGLREEFPSRSNLLPSSYEMADKSYVRWEANGGVDLQLPSFKLTNRQMLWVCMAHKLAEKHHRDAPQNFNEYVRIINDYLHLFMKRKRSFREAFQCNNHSKDEENQAKKFRKRTKSFFQRHSTTVNNFR